MKDRCDIYKPLMGVMERKSSDPQWSYVADKSAWILTSVMGRTPRYFQDDRVTNTVNVLMTASACTELGVLEAITNLLKAPFRAVVWTAPGVQDKILSISATKSSPMVYKCVFAIWMLSFEPDLVSSLKSAEVIKKLKSIMTESRVEKVIRLCVTVLKNFLAQKSSCQAICEDIVEEGVLEAAQQLEYEKWRDQELYDDIRELVALITSEVKELSNFDRYMRELESGQLAWGFIHSSKFFGENILKFDNGEFKALKLLASCLASGDVTTLAVACHDIGEFVSLHPLGKKQVGRLGVKERVMELMSSTDPSFREVRREALLCCQKIMLNKWQDVAAVDKK
jgi:V-type H+-transporting ATPase subunit H